MFTPMMGVAGISEEQLMDEDEESPKSYDIVDSNSEADSSEIAFKPGLPPGSEDAYSSKVITVLRFHLYQMCDRR